ncbi:hypothetical protein BV25DRAFT_1832122 [Artomyces pyxidatus]|uniref:Uncharacterized protein n=1 Tax=Artomyces pyxidatus TaxID=48021 RepID=A0ACB8SL16_9AGAM|nr:hypothetical protein BV25DRAFT_1832122 [Artomyces pyxidatus]
MSPSWFSSRTTNQSGTPRYAPPPGPPPTSTQQVRYQPPPGPPPGRQGQEFPPPPGPPPSHASSSRSNPPAWAPAPERSHTLGLYNEASDDNYRRAEAFCAHNPLQPPGLLPSDVVERIQAEGSGAWGIQWPSPAMAHTVDIQGDVKGDPARSTGAWRVRSKANCTDLCLLSSLPIAAGLYDIRGKQGVYYEVRVNRMDGVIAIGTACKPYPEFRLPGWNRLSAALHLDDRRKFFEDPDGGRDYASMDAVAAGDVVGCGYEFARGALFFTHNGRRLEDAFTGIYLPRVAHDVYAAIGVDGKNDLEVNFGGTLFEWKAGNDWAWRVEGHVGTMAGSAPGQDEDLPAYEARG